MNNYELTQEIALRTGIDPVDCNKVLKAFEEIVEEQVSGKKWKSHTFGIVFGMMERINRRRQSKENKS